MPEKARKVNQKKITERVGDSIYFFLSAFGFFVSFLRALFPLAIYQYVKK
jgi:hypothetical protein